MIIEISGIIFSSALIRNHSVRSKIIKQKHDNIKKYVEESNQEHKYLEIEKFMNENRVKYKNIVNVLDQIIKCKLNNSKHFGWIGNVFLDTNRFGKCYLRINGVSKEFNI